MSNAPIPNEDGSRPEPKPARTLPDVAICRARHSGIGDYADCLVDAPYGCRYALSYGHRCFCLNPEREEIVARTEAKQRE